MKTTILQDDREDFKKSKLQFEMTFAETSDICAAVTLMVCGRDVTLAALATQILANGNAEQREKILTKLNQVTEGTFSILIDFLRHAFNARDVVHSHAKPSQPVEGKD